jgi:enoyl-CoA hydratase
VKSPSDQPLNTPDALVTRDGPIMTLTFNRPQTRNAMTWDMYDRLLQTCEEVDADDSVRVLVLRGAGGKAFVAGTDISQFKVFETAEDGLAYERDGAARSARLERVKKPVIAQIQGFAVGGGFNITACCDIRIATPDAKFGAPIARTLGNCLSMETYARFVDLLGSSIVKDVIFRARFLSAQEALAAGYVHEIVAPEEIDARVKAIALEIADHAPITIQVTKESLRRIRDHRGLPDGDDLVARTYTSADFREGAAAFIEKRKPRWTGK